MMVLLQLLQLLFIVAAAISFVLAPVCVIGYYLFVSKLGVEVAKRDPALWEEIRPRLNTNMSRQARQQERLHYFVREREYLEFGDARITKLGNRVRLLDRGAIIFGITWFAFFFWMWLR
jgi:hypothetical protein